MKGLGKQDDASWLSLMCQALIGLSSSYLLGFHFGFGNPGLLYGACIGYFCMFVAVQLSIWGQDWHQIAT
jgi:Na+-driven multidrug efflux pump